jgi:glycosyltransferase involved in cell wall biosynthesis
MGTGTLEGVPDFHMLTISIPTFDRPEQLRNIVTRLLPQLDESCELRIYDNCSAMPVDNVLADVLKPASSASRIKVIRNPVNVGLCGNILRCMEDCPSKWLVTCGDDDPPRPDFVARAKRAIAKYPESIFISFGFLAQKRSNDFTTNGLSEFVRGNWIFGDVLSISSGAFRMDLLKSYMATGYMYTYTLGPHIAIVLTALQRSGGQCAFVADQIADGPENLALESWSRIWYPSAVLLLELVTDRENRQILGDKLISYMVSQDYLAKTLIANALETGSDNSFLFASRMKLRSLLLSSPAISIKEKIFGYLVKNPALGLKILNRISRQRKYGGLDAPKESIFSRI